MADYNVTYDVGSMSIMLDSEQVERALGDLKGKTPAAPKVAVNRTARQADHAAHQRVNRAARGGDPLGLPRLAAFSRLKPRNPCSLVARLIAHRHPPIIARAGREGDRGMVGEGIRVGVLGAVVQGFG